MADEAASNSRVTELAVAYADALNERGVPINGATGQVLRKTSDVNFATEWADPEGGIAGPGSAVVGQVVLWGDTSATTLTAGVFDQTLVQYFGDGSDGNVTVSGSVTLLRDMAYNNLTVSTGAAINPNGFIVRVKGTLDITAAPAGWIVRNGNVGSAASGQTAGQPGTILLNGTLPSLAAGLVGGAGGAGGISAAGGNSAANNAGTRIQGGRGGVGGAGGASGANAGGTVPAFTGVLEPGIFFVTPQPTPSYANKLVQPQPSCGTSGGGGGAGVGGNGGGGGGSGGPGAFIAIYAFNIERGGSTAARGIQVVGGVGGAGAAGVSGTSGGGGGGPGGGGGDVWLIYGSLSGTSATNLIDLTGGAGGVGGNALGSADGGDGGGSGYGGVAFIGSLLTGVFTYTASVVGVAGTAHSGTSGGAGATATTSQVSL